jgi:hypothetical protein
MNKVCFPIGLNMTHLKPTHFLCIKKGFSFEFEKQLLDKVYDHKRPKKMSLKTQPKKRTKTKKNY